MAVGLTLWQWRNQAIPACVARFEAVHLQCCLIFGGDLRCLQSLAEVLQLALPAELTQPALS